MWSKYSEKFMLIHLSVNSGKSPMWRSPVESSMMASKVGPSHSCYGTGPIVCFDRSIFGKEDVRKKKSKLLSSKNYGFQGQFLKSFLIEAGTMTVRQVKGLVF